MKIKEWNRVTLTLFFIGLMLLTVTEGMSRVAIVYALIMSLYFLASELFEFHLWSSSDSKRRQLKFIVNELEKQKNEQVNK